MMQSRNFTIALAATALLMAAPIQALGQTKAPDQHHEENQSEPAASPAPQRGMMQGMPDGGMMPMMDGSGAGMGMGMMGCPMMSQMMRMHPEMMGMMHGQMGRGGGMMGQGPGSGMMMGQSGGSGMMNRQGAMSLDSGVVTPIRHLSSDDVRHDFEHRLKLMGNDRLKLGAVTQTDEDTIVVEIVTVDNSLVDRFRVDRHSAAFQRAK
jgi:hypothetical protein